MRTLNHINYLTITGSLGGYTQGATTHQLLHLMQDEAAASDRASRYGLLPTGTKGSKIGVTLDISRSKSEIPLQDTYAVL